MENALGEFFRIPEDLDHIASATLRGSLSDMAFRFESACRAIELACGFAEGTIRYRLPRDGRFIASVGRDPERDGYLIEMSSAMPINIAVLLERIVAQPAVLPWLPVERKAEFVRYEMSLARDPLRIGRRTQWLIETNQIRSFAAWRLSDIAVFFVFLHELGHIASGHIDAIEGLDEATCGERASIAEFHRGHSNQKRRARALAWEYEADKIGGMLLMQLVDSFVERTTRGSDMAWVFGEGDQARMRCVNLATISLYVLFSYLRGTRIDLSLFNSHPHPTVRAFLLQDTLVGIALAKSPEMRRAWVEDLTARFLEFNKAMIDLGVMPEEALFREGYVEAAQGAGDRLASLRDRMAHAWRRFSFIEWSRPE